MVGFNSISKMKKVLYLLLAAFFFFFITSCGEKGLKPQSVNISGPLGKYFKIVDRVYQENNGSIYIEFQRIEDGLPKPWTEDFGMVVGWNDGEVEPSFTIEYYNKNGNIVCKAKTLDLSSSHFDDDKDDLQKMVNLSKGESSSIAFDITSKDAVQFSISSSFEYHPAKIEIKLSPSQEAEVGRMVDRYQQMAVSIITQQKEEDRLNLGLYSSSKDLANQIREKIGDCSSIHYERFSDIERVLESSATFGPDSNALDFIEKYKDTVATTTDSWDSLLDDFEELVNKYIECVKEAKDGNAEAIITAAKYAQECDELSKKLSNLNDEDVSEGQMERIIELSQKYTNFLLQLEN